MRSIKQIVDQEVKANATQLIRDTQMEADERQHLLFNFDVEEARLELRRHGIKYGEANEGEIRLRLQKNGLRVCRT
ncbi:MAG: hypothetical protein ACSHYA_18555 [Opitutaceae bacterium]